MSERRAKAIKAYEPEAQDSEWHLGVVEGGERLAKMRLHRGAAGNTSNFINGAWNVGAMAELRREMAVKCLDRPDARAARVVNRNSANLHWYLMAGLVVEKGESFRRL